MQIYDDLREIGLLSGGVEPEFDRVTRLSARLLGCETSLFSVIDEPGDRQYFKAAIGLGHPWAERGETPLSHSFCKTVVAEGAVVRVTDARRDPRFRNNRAVDELGVTSYLGVPVQAAPGQVIGALCAISGTACEWSIDDEETLLGLAAGLSRTVELRMALHKQRAMSAEVVSLNKQFNDLAENVPGAIFRYLVRPDGRDEVEYMSPGCQDIWEASAGEIEENIALLWDIIVPEDAQGMRSSIGRSAQLLTPWQHRWRVVTRSGTQKHLQGYGRPRALDDGSILWNSAIFDVTVEVEAQEKLRAQDQLLADAQKQEIIGRLAGGVAHDFNNLLAVVMGNAELVLDDANSSDTETYLSEIVQAATLGSDLTRSLLSFARKSHLRPVVIEMNAAIMGMETLLRRALPESVAVRTALAEGLWQVEADRSELERALLNLALNARDAMPNGGKLTVETANVTFPDDDITGRHDAVAPGRYVMLAVSDTGTGIAPEILDRVFEPFFTTKGPDKGTGLGLPMVQGFAQQSGGAVRIYSEPGKGVSVKVYLHAVAGRASARAARPKRIPGPSTGCVLVVEDNDAVRVSVTRSLKAAGYSVVAAPSGDAALALLDDTCTGFDIVLTDVVMPGQLQGPDLVHQIRARRPDMPVVFMSGYPHEANVHGNGIRKNDISLMKPVGRAELLFALEKALRKK